MPKILIVEDEKNLARFVELELQHEGYETVVENNGRKAARPEWVGNCPPGSAN